MKSFEAQSLAQDILAFLAEYAKMSADDEEKCWSSPDACMMEIAAIELQAVGMVPAVPHSSWESGGYGPYTSTKGRELHDKLKERTKAFLEKKS